MAFSAIPPVILAPSNALHWLPPDSAVGQLLQQFHGGCGGAKASQTAATHLPPNPLHLTPGPSRGRLGYPKSAPTSDISCEPHWINSRQYEAILRRRLWRAAHLQPIADAEETARKESYHYLSLHRHAKKRLRSANGKFLSKAEIAKLTPEEIARLEQLMVEKEKEKMAAAAAMTNTPEPNPPKRRRTAAAPGRGHAVDSDEE